jgi:selenouridine synthase SelU-like subunit
MIIFGLFGKTGCGKTEILQELKKYHPVVDIEECGNTRGSVLGDLYHLKQHSQEIFEKLLNEQKKTAEEKGYCIVEFEGRKIGGTEKLNIPEPFSNLKYYNYNIIIECPYECQIQRLLKYYTPKNEKEKEILISKFKILKKIFVKPEKLEYLDKIINLIEKDDYYNAAIVIEEKLYQEHYVRSIKKVKPDLTIYNEDLDKSVEIINDFINKKLKECREIR